MKRQSFKRMKIARGIAILFFTVVMGSCKKDNPSPVTPPASPKEITSFNFEGLLTIVKGTIAESVENTITLKINYDVPLTALVPTIKFTGSSVSPASGVAQDFTSPVKYTVTATDGSTEVYKVMVIVALPSTNTELHWSITNGLDRSVFSIAVSGKNIYEGTDSGVFRSINYGKWVSTGLPSSSVKALAVSGGRLLAGTDNGIFISTDSANTWTPKNSGVTDLNVLSLIVANDSVYAGTKNGNVYLSANNADGWTSITNGFSNGLAIYSIAVHGSNIFIGTGDGVFLSKNKGSSWQIVGFVNMSVTSVISANNNIFAGTTGISNGGTISLSTDNGSTWTPVYGGLISG